MNRLIKFRAWDKEKKVMIHDQDQKVGKIYDIPLGSYIPNTIRRIGDYHGTYMQFTGLHDSAGKEIYEGDLLKYSKDDGVILEVFYHDHEARFKCSRAHWKKNRCGGFIPDITSSNLEVIGNVFSNPELLEGEE